MPLRDYVCLTPNCDSFETIELLVKNGEHPKCEVCKEEMHTLLSSHAGYRFANGSGGASVTPKNAGSSRKSK